MSLAQQALDLAVGAQTRMAQGGDVATRANLSDLAVAVQLLAQNALSSSPSSESLDGGDTNVDVSTTTGASTEPSGS